MGRIDILVNNAGFGIFKTFEDASMDEVKDMFQVNVFGLVACTKAVLPYMVKETKDILLILHHLQENCNAEIECVCSDETCSIRIYQ